jgi:excisionase family DNA binding protein
MQSANKLPGLPDVVTANFGSDDLGVEIRSLLQHLQVAVDDLRDQLKPKRKSHYAVEEIADIVGRSPYTVRRWISEGRIHAMRVGGTGPRGRLLISRDQLDTLVGRGLAADLPDSLAE